jgi:hypothetical protein
VLREVKRITPGEVGSVNVSFRINLALRNELANEAEKKNLSLNSLVGGYLQRSIVWGRVQQQFEYLSVSKDLLETLLEHLRESEIASIARRLLAPRLRDLANFIYGSTDLDGLLQVVELTAKYQYPSPATYDFREVADCLHIFIRHGVSQKWSVFLGEGYVAYLESMGMKASYDATRYCLMLTIPKREPLKI